MTEIKYGVFIEEKNDINYTEKGIYRTCKCP